MVPKLSLGAEKIRIGSLIANHKRPDVPFHTLDSWTFAATPTPPAPFKVRVDSESSGKVGLFASFAGLFHAKAEHSRSRKDGQWLSSTSTVQETFEPDAELLQSISMNAAVQNYLQEHDCKVVYLITGVKRGENVWLTSASERREGYAGEGGGGGAGATGGLTGEHGQGNAVESDYFVKGPVVFAVELTELWVQRDGSVEANVKSGDFFGIEDEEELKLVFGPDDAALEASSGIEIVDGWDEADGTDCQIVVAD